MAGTGFIHSTFTIYHSPILNLQKAQLDDVRVGRLQLFERVGGRRGFEVDAGDGRLGALEDDVLHLLHVDGGGLDGVEHGGEDAGAVAVADGERVRGGRARGEVDDVGDLA